MSLFFIVSALVVWLMQVLVGTWFKISFEMSSWTMPVKVLPLFFTVCFTFSLYYTHTHWEGVIAEDLYRFGYIWLGAVFIAFYVSAAFLGVYGLLKLVHAPVLWMGKLSIYVMLGLIGWGVWNGFKAPEIKTISVKSEQLPSMKIAVLSDTHLGMGVSLERFNEALERLEAQNPDVLFVLGDVFEFGLNREDYAVRIRAVGTPLGSYGVLGNHEYYTGYGESKQFFKDAHINLLENEIVTLSNGVQIVGLRDILTARVGPQEVQEVLKNINPGAGAVLLSHTPLYAEEAAANGFDLMLSGHTHNGQIWPFNYLVKKQFPYIYGLHNVKGMPFYITSGMFYWGPPMRLFAPAEIPIIEVN